MPDHPDDPRQDDRRNRNTAVNPLAEFLAILPPEARRVLRNVAEEAARATLRAGGGPNPLATAAATATRLLSEAARQQPETRTSGAHSGMPRAGRGSPDHHVRGDSRGIRLPGCPSPGRIGGSSCGAKL
jgi:hypothetical protein